MQVVVLVLQHPRCHTARSQLASLHHGQAFWPNCQAGARARPGAVREGGMRKGACLWCPVGFSPASRGSRSPSRAAAPQPGCSCDRQWRRSRTQSAPAKFGCGSRSSPGCPATRALLTRQPAPLSRKARFVTRGLLAVRQRAHQSAAREPCRCNSAWIDQLCSCAAGDMPCSTSQHVAPD